MSVQLQITTKKM